MSRIVHLSLKVDDIQKSGDFYQKMFNFQDTTTKKTRDHTSRHMTDGEIDFTLIQYDAGTTSAEDALKQAQDYTTREMTKAGYIK